MLPWIVASTNLVCAAACSLLAVPLVRRRVAPNDHYGIRLARAFESDEIWYEINEYGGRRMIFWSIPVALAGLAPLLFTLADWEIVLIACAPFAYGFGCWETIRRLEQLEPALSR